MSIECTKSECRWHNMYEPFCDEEECNYQKSSIDGELREHLNNLTERIIAQCANNQEEKPSDIIITRILYALEKAGKIK